MTEDINKALRRVIQEGLGLEFSHGHIADTIGFSQVSRALKLQAGDRTPPCGLDLAGSTREGGQ